MRLGAAAADQFPQIVGIVAGAGGVTEDSSRRAEQCQAQQVGQGLLQFALQVLQLVGALRLLDNR
ncbi:hypothetical protein D3C78_1913490 [compost metagenome]